MTTKEQSNPSDKSISNTRLFFGVFVIFLFAIFLLPVTPSFSGAPAPQPGAMLRSLSASNSVIEVGSAAIFQGDMVTVPITATIPLTASLTAFTIHVEYDPTILGYAGCSVGSDFTGLCNNSDNDGTPPDVVSFSAVNPFGINGVLELGDITFNGDALGTSPLHLEIATWSDDTAITPTTIDGQINVLAVPTDTPTPTATNTSTPTSTSTSTPTPTSTSTPSPTPTTTQTPSPTSTFTPSPTATTTQTPTATAPSTVTSTPTATATSTPTATATIPVEDDYKLYLPAILR